MAKQKKVIEVSPGRGYAWWTTLSPEQKRALVFPRLEVHESNKAIAEYFGITPNSIASIRDRWNKGGHKNPFELQLVEKPVVQPKRKEPPMEQRKSARSQRRPTPTAPKRSEHATPAPTLSSANDDGSPISSADAPPAPPQRTYGARSTEKPRFSGSEWDSCDHEDVPGKKCGFVGSIRKKTGKFCPNHAHLHE